MLYLLYGADTAKAKKKLRALELSLLGKKPDASVLRFDTESFDATSIPELLCGQGLFVKKYVVILERVCAKSETKEVLLSHIKDVASSDNIFIVFEENCDTKTLAKLKKHAAKTEVFEKKVTRQVQKAFNIFSLADALGERSRKKLWVLYQKALREGFAVEEIHGILFWQVKSMLLARGSNTPSEAGLKPFVFQKSSRFAQNFTPQELKALSAAFLTVYHNARRGKHEFSLALEHLVVTL